MFVDLIDPFICEIAPVDPAAVAADPDGGGVLTSGYDYIFGEPVAYDPTPNDLVADRVDARVESAVVQVRAQIEVVSSDMLEPTRAGPRLGRRIRLVMHLRDLEAAGLVDGATGEVTVPRINDRLHRILLEDGVTLVELVKPNLYCIEPAAGEFGIGRTRNLVIATFDDRKASV